MPSPCWHLGQAAGAELPVVLLPLPYTSCTSHISKVRRKCRFRVQPELIRRVLCPPPSLFRSGCLLGWCGHTPPPLPTMGCAYQDPKWTQPFKMLLSCLDAEFPVFPYFTFPLGRFQAQLMLSPNSFAWIFFSFFPTNSRSSACSTQTATPLQIFRIWAFPLFYELLLKRRLVPSLTVEMGVPSKPKSVLRI